MRNFLSLHNDAFGLDISDLSLKIVKLEKKDKGVVLASFGETALKPGIIAEGEIKDEKAVAEAIKKVLKEVRGKKIDTKCVIASLPEEKSFLQVIQMPRLSEEDLKSAVIYEAENYIPLPIEKVYLDFQVVAPLYDHLDHLDVLIVALPKRIVDPYVSCLQLAGLKPVALEVESLALSRALIKGGTAASPCVLIDFGAARTGFIIFSGYCPGFTSSIPVSSGALTEAIAGKMNIDLEEADDLKIHYGLDSSTKEGAKVFEAMIPLLTELAGQVKKYLNYHRSHASHEHLPPNSKPIGKIFICGGGANLKNIVDFLSSQINISVELGDPWVNVSLKNGKAVTIPQKESLQFATAMGLALRNIT